ncbi:MAG: DUF3592 domain-containing protein [Ferruginibacter sp.]
MAWIPVGIIILGFIPLLIVWLKQWLMKKFIAKAALTTGTVEAVELRTGHKGNRYFVATINYIAGYEMVRKNYTRFYSKRNTLSPGQQVAVLYDPKKPGKFLLRDLPYNFKAAWIFTGIIAVAYFVLAYFLYKELQGTYFSPGAYK